MRIIRITHEETEEAQVKENILSFSDRVNNINNQAIKKLLTDSQKSMVSIISSIAVAGIETFETIAQLKKEHRFYKELFEEFTDYINTVEVISLNDVYLRYPNTKRPSLGLYTLHPIDNFALCPLDNYHGRLSMDKDAELLELLGKMGAKKVIIETENINQNSHSFNVNANVSAGESEINSGHHKQNTANTRRVYEYEGKKTNIPNDLLKHSIWFNKDSELNGIFASRIFSENRIQRYEYISTYSETFDFDFSIAAKYLGNSVDVKAQYEQMRNKKKTFIIEFA